MHSEVAVREPTSHTWGSHPLGAGIQRGGWRLGWAIRADNTEAFAYLGQQAWSRPWEQLAGCGVIVGVPGTLGGGPGTAAPWSFLNSSACPRGLRTGAARKGVYIPSRPAKGLMRSPVRPPWMKAARESPGGSG